MDDDTRDPVDHSRTFRPHAGESLIDRAAWPGLALIALGVVALVLCLTAVAYQLFTWTVVAALVSIALFVAGSVWLTLERRRVRAIERRWHEEHSIPEHD